MTFQLPRRRGSVLILVVALIVILALLGTAYIATARLDRYDSASAGVQTMVDPQADELTTEVTSAISRDLFDVATNSYRPWWYPTGASANKASYTHFDSNRPDPVNPTGANKPWDPWLADRIPSVDTKNQIIWRGISQLPSKTFVDIQQAVLGKVAPVTTYTPLANGMMPPLLPTSVAVVYTRTAGNASLDQPSVFPALQVLDAAGNAVGTPILAADAAGSGIADSFLFDLNVTTPSPAGPISYFGAVRIVDNNSAINVNSALSKAIDFTIASGALSASDALGKVPGATYNLGGFPSHIGLKELLDPAMPGAEIQAMQNWWLHGLTPSVTWYEAGASIGAYTFRTFGDELFNQLVRRMNNPASVGAVANIKYQSAEDSGKLAWRFNMLDPSASGSYQQQFQLFDTTKVEERLYRSTVTDAINFVQQRKNRWTLYPADKALYWFDYSFNSGNATLDTAHDNEGASYSQLSLVPNFYRNPRAMLVAHNPLSLSTPIHSYGPNAANNQSPRQVPVPPPGGVAAASYMDPYQKASTNIPRTSINTAPFSELWRAYWNVMCDDADGSKAASPSNRAFVAKSFAPATWTDADHLLIRAAVAAANAEALRDTSATSGDVISHHLILPGADVEVFGYKRQPFITAYSTGVDGSSKGHMTLYNPCGTTLIKMGLEAVFLDAGTQVMTGMGGVQVTTIPGSASVDFSFVVDTTGTSPVWDSSNNKYKPGQIFLMRTRAASGAIGSASGVDTYDETNPKDLVPLDHVDALAAGYSRTADWSCVQNKAAGAGTPVQLFADNFPTSGAGGSQYPFGQFARLGDILTVPFVGNYRVTVGGTAQFVCVTDDTVACDNNNAKEDIGRFCPLSATPQYAGNADAEMYQWARRLFDQFTTMQNPNDDYAPNMLGGRPIINSAGVTTANTHNEDNTGIEGLININTAPWQVLAMLPMVKHGKTTVAGGLDDNSLLAQAIVYFRDVDDGTGKPHGPFRSIFELNQVYDVKGGNTSLTFQNAWGTLTVANGKDDSTKIGPDDGDFSGPSVNLPLGNYVDFKWKFLTLTRISNLVTTRSDTFTCYVLVQAWQNAGTLTPTLIAQKRLAFIANRVPVGDKAPAVQTQSIDYGQ